MCVTHREVQEVFSDKQMQSVHMECNIWQWGLAGTTGKHIVTANQCYPGCSWLNLETVVNWIRQPERQLAHTHIAQIECSVVRVMVVRWSNSNHWTSGQMVSGCYLLDSVVNLCSDVYTLGVIYLCLVELDMHFLFGIRQNNLWPASVCDVPWSSKGAFK